MKTRDGLRIATRARDRFELPTSLFDPDGRLPLATVSTARRVADRVTTTRTARGEAADGSVNGGELSAYGLIDAILHRVIELYLEQVEPAALESALAATEAAVGPLPVGRTLAIYDTSFPARTGLEPATEAGRAAVLEELLLTWLGNANPAAAPFRELFDDRPLAGTSAYPDLLEVVSAHFEALPPFGPEGTSLIALLRAPALAAPDSLTGQLEYIRDRWAPLLGDFLERLLVALSVLAEEERALWMRLHPWPGGAGEATSAALGGFAGAGAELEAFSMDKDWMPKVVLMAKSTYVWLDQLSRRYSRDIHTLDAIPDEELDTLARWGVTGLWLIGLWQRSRASERIKRMRGNPEAVASAYSLEDYRIADDLGGEAAWDGLRDRAWRRGIRLASDMVPNHMGIDSRWVVEHPERFLSLPYPPYPGYSFGGPDLSDDGRATIRIEDHYWDGTDAAVVFQRVDGASGEVRYIYHGNDGTSFPWNDTAQLDYVDPAVREAVIQTILDVARRFPIIRFDAAMTLAKKHIQRLWYPVPGSTGSIPSRAEHAMSQEAFDAAIPIEFWREVVDRVATEAPDTLLLAEAFWLMEGYFVRTLGMHRVYNSAFMHMLRDEDNAGYRSVMKNTLEFDPEILKRYVNFMNNPDEKTAVEQFGKGDKYFGVATVMATLPGLPMLGHGQVEGFTEKYGMEYRRAYYDEQPDGWLVERHERELFPLLHRRRIFAEVADFLLYDVYRDDGGVDEDVFAYSNGRGAERSLVVYHNRFKSTSGWIRESASYSVPDGAGGRRSVRRTLGDGWGLPADPGVLVRYRDLVSGLEYLQRSSDIHERGLFVALEAYGRHVFVDVSEVHDGTAGLWGRLADRLGGRGVPSLDESLRELELEPVHAAARGLLAVAGGALDPGAPDRTALLDTVEERAVELFRAVAEATGTTGDPAPLGRAARERLDALPMLASAELQADVAAVAARTWADPVGRGALIGWAIFDGIGALAEGAPAAETGRAWLDELALVGVLGGGLRALGLDDGAAWTAAERTRALVGLTTPTETGGPAGGRAGALLAAWLDAPAVRTAMGVNTWDGVEWLAREALEALLDAAVAIEAVRAGLAGGPSGRRGAPDPTGVAAVADTLRAAAESAGYRVDTLRSAVGADTAARPRAGAKTPKGPKAPKAAPDANATPGGTSTSRGSRRRG